MTKRISVMALILSLMILVGCATQPGGTPGSQTASTPGVTDSEIVLGSFSPLSGPAAAFGSCGRAARAYFQMVNERGGIHGRQVKFLLEDDGYDPARTVAITKKLVEQDQVFALTAGVGSANNHAILDYLVEQGVPHLPVENQTPQIYDPVRPGIYAFPLPTLSEAKVAVDFAIQDLGAKNIGLFFQNDDYGRVPANEIKRLVEGTDTKIVGDVAYNVSDADYSAHALKLKDSGAEVVMAWGTVSSYASLLKEADKIGFHPKWIASPYMADPALLKLAPTESQGTYYISFVPDVTDSSNDSIEAIKEYKEFLPKFEPDVPLGSLSVMRWGAAGVMHEALERAGRDLTREKLIEAAHTLDSFKYIAPVSYTENDRRGTNTAWVVQVQGERFVKVSDEFITH